MGINPENDNVDIHVELEDGRIFGFVVATPNNIYRCMANEGVEYYFGIPPVFVCLLTKEHVAKAFEALIAEYGGRWLDVYGTPQVCDSDTE